MWKNTGDNKEVYNPFTQRRRKEDIFCSADLKASHLKLKICDFNWLLILPLSKKVLDKLSLRGVNKQRKARAQETICHKKSFSIHFCHFCIKSFKKHIPELELRLTILYRVMAGVTLKRKHSALKQL